MKELSKKDSSFLLSDINERKANPKMFFTSKKFKYIFLSIGLLYLFIFLIRSNNIDSPAIISVPKNDIDKNLYPDSDSILSTSLLASSSSLSPYSSSIDQIVNDDSIMNPDPKKVDLKRFELLANKNYNSKINSVQSLRSQLSSKFPYNYSLNKYQKMPKFIWQTWKTDPSNRRFPKTFRKFSNSWKNINEDFIHKILPDKMAIELIKNLYYQIPEVLISYKLLPSNILKADFFRYLILFANGGTYTDIDTVDLKPINTWLSYNETIFGDLNDIGFVVGIEADPDRPDWKDWYARRIQFCQWTIQSKRGHPILRELVSKISHITLNKYKKNDLKLKKTSEKGSQIMNWTGPGIFTDTIFEYLNNVIINNPDIKIINYNPKYVIKQNEYDDSTDANLDIDKMKAGNYRKINKSAKTPLTWEFFTGMEIPIIIDDVLILPISSFSPGVGQMGSHKETHPLAYAKHMFEGSWKDEDDRKIGKS
ncbi:glycosyltransferase family 32 protein [Ascoidea rubescens DSM 1968]|uniref:Glycosyltransferase family 32 protein n=1 Tax=Ascoidea rubescens DSM 1968 TaxID=1344418 RepID=A0A1D2VMB1_9ASCO|nr:glycosyltransferase family 32 protein [Ascoidea rubescens DSM 1968]ODV62714.1 glycosyltransferase family 32 protein [Ascoidea rubescens DSM 1968]